MRDFPIFPTDYGVASLVLRQIPYRGEAYIHIQDVQPGALEQLLEECRGFCRMAGAERVLCCGQSLEHYPLHTSELRMQTTAWVDPQKLRSLFPVTEQTVAKWRAIYNEKMRPVDCASILESRDEARVLSSAGAYFVHEEGTLLGIGWMEDTKLLAMAAVRPGAGELVMHSLMSLVEGSTVTLEVASTNHRAIALYERLGFLKTGELRQWRLV